MHVLVSLLYPLCSVNETHTRGRLTDQNHVPTAWQGLAHRNRSTNLLNQAVNVRLAHTSVCCCVCAPRGEHTEGAYLCNICLSVNMQMMLSLQHKKHFLTAPHLRKTYATPWGASACTKTSKVTLSSSINPFSGSVTSYKKKEYPTCVRTHECSFHSKETITLVLNRLKYYFFKHQIVPSGFAMFL